VVWPYTKFRDFAIFARPVYCSWERLETVTCGGNVS